MYQHNHADFACADRTDTMAGDDKSLCVLCRANGHIAPWDEPAWIAYRAAHPAADTASGPDTAELEALTPVTH